MNNPAPTHSERAARYLRGEMTAAEATELEIELLDNDALFQEMEMQNALMQGLRTTEISEERRPWWRKFRPYWSYAKPAGFSILVICLVIQTSRLKTAEDTIANYAQPQVDVPLFTVNNARSNNPASNLTYKVAKKTKQIILATDIPEQENTEYEIEILSLKNIPILKETATTDPNGYLVFSLPTEKNKLILFT